MKYITKIISITLTFCFIYSTVITNIQGHGLGVGPPFIPIDSAVRNTTIQQTIWIYNSENNYGTNINLNSTGETKDWITFYEYDNTTNPINSTFIQNLTDKRIIIKILIPPDAANREYTGTLLVASAATQTNTNDTNQSTVELNLPIMLSINVTGDQDLNATVNSIKIEDVEIYYDAKISVDFENTGNVIAKPTIDVTFSKDGQYVGNLSSTTNPIQPGNIDIHRMTWNTSHLILSGTYNANFKITLDGDVIEQQNISFEVLPEGTLLRNGTLEKITCSGKFEKDKPLDIVATFRNTGEIETKAQFFVKIYRNGELIDSKESNKKDVEKFQQKLLTIQYTPEKDGSYKINGYVTYSDIHDNEKETDPLEMKFTVGDSRSLLKQLLDFFQTTTLFIIISLVILSILLFYLLKKKGIVNVKKRSLSAKTPSPTKKEKQNKIRINKNREITAKTNKKGKTKVKKLEKKKSSKKTRKRIRIRRDKTKSPLKKLSENKVKKTIKEKDIEKKIDKLISPRNSKKNK